MIDLDLLHAFSVFAEHRNFTRAAAALHISQPALHVKVRKLGEELGVTLYHRSGRRLLLSEAGERVARFGRESADRQARFVAALREEASSRPVVLCAGEGAYLYLLGGAIGRYLRRPPAPLRLLTADAEGTIEAVRSARAHLGVCVLGTPPDDLRAKLVRRVGPQVVFPAGHRLARRKTATVRDLDGEPLVVPPEGRPHRAALESAFTEAGADLQVAVEAGGWELMLRFCALGLGLAVVNGLCHVPAGLRALPLRGLPATDYVLLRRRGGFLPEPAKQLAELIGS